MQVEHPGRPHRSRQLPGGGVGCPYVTDLSLPDHVVEGAQGFLDRRSRIPSVEIVDIDVVGLQTLQAFFQLLKDVVAGTTALIRAVEACAWAASAGNFDAHFGGDDDFAPLRGLADDLTDELLGMSICVDVRRIDEVDAEIEALMEDCLRPLEIRTSTKVIRPDAKNRNIEACPTKLTVFHLPFSVVCLKLNLYGSSRHSMLRIGYEPIIP